MKPIRLIQWMILVLALVKAFSMMNSVDAQTPEAAFTLYMPSSVNGKQSSPPPPAPNQGTLPAELVTTWYTGVAPANDFYDPTTGEWRATNGLGEMYQFSANGHFTYAGFLRIQNGQCLSEVSTYRQGMAKAANAQLTLTPSLAKTRTVVRCGSNSDSTTDGPFDAVMIGYTVDEDTGGLIHLNLTGKDNTTSYYREGMVESLVGSWKRGGVDSANFYDAATHSFAAQNDAGAWFHFNADGTYTFGEYGFFTTEQGCVLTGWIYLEGTLSISGGKLTTTPSAGASRVDNGCAPGAPEVKSYTEDARSYTWFYRDQATDEKLVIIPLERFEEFVYSPE